MIPRILEPEIMESADEVSDYDAMDHNAVNDAFVTDFLASLPASFTFDVSADRKHACSILDVGTGTSLIPIILAKRWKECRITAIDLSAEMLTVARRNIEAAQLSNQITVELEDAKSLTYPDNSFDAIISNSIMHHLAAPFDALAEMIRVARNGGVLFVRDLLRPSSHEEVKHLVSTYAACESAQSQKLFQDSLHAALTLDEVRAMLCDANLPLGYVRQTSDRHWTLSGAL